MRSVGGALAVAALAFGIVACSSTGGPAEPAAAMEPAPAPTMEAALGVRLERLQLSAAGYLLDMRYRVLDADKARALFERRVRPVLIDASTGLQVTVPDTPKLGQLRSIGARSVKVDRTYSILFANPGRTIERGSRLTLLLGEARIDGLLVE